MKTIRRWRFLLIRGADSGASDVAVAPPAVGDGSPAEVDGGLRRRWQRSELLLLVSQ